MSKSLAWTHDSVNNKSVDWYTPPEIFELLGLEFDLDPCSPKGGVPWIPVKQHFSIEDDGLAQPWSGLVWCNPPYGKQTSLWLKRCSEHGNGIALVFARTDTKWYHEYVSTADAVLFLKGRVKFVDGLGKTGGGGAGSGSMLIAWGDTGVAALKRARNSGHLVLS